MEEQDNLLPLLPAYDIAKDYQEASEFIANELRFIDSLVKNDKDFYNTLNKLFNTWE